MVQSNFLLSEKCQQNRPLVFITGGGKGVKVAYYVMAGRVSCLFLNIPHLSSLYVMQAITFRISNFPDVFYLPASWSD